MNSRTLRQFRRLLADLPPVARSRASLAYKFFQSNPAHPSLQFKQVRPDPPTYSARIAGGYRALGILRGDTVFW